MIKTYQYTQPMNSVSHILIGQGGNTVRFNFTNGNVITKKLPELTLRGKYYQELLESSDLFTSGKVRKVREVEDPSEKKETEKATPVTASVEHEKEVEEVLEVRSSDELIAYVNQRWDKKFILPHKALDFASKENVKFPNYNP